MRTPVISKEIADTLRFFENEGHRVFIALSKEFSEECRGELAEFLRADDGSRAENVPVIYDGGEIAKIFADGAKENLSALCAPLKYMLCALYEEDRKTVSEAIEHDVYKKAIRYIKEHYTENITVTDVAAHIGYSESYFGYAFKKKYKMSVSRYIRELQLAKAKDLLENTSFSVASVAGYVGFDDSNYFSALFKKYFGLSPKEYRNKHSTLVT